MITFGGKTPQTIYIGGKEVAQIQINNDIVWTNSTAPHVDTYNINFIEQSDSSYNCVLDFGMFHFTDHLYCWLNELNDNDAYPNWYAELIYGNNIVTFNNSNVVRYDSALVTNIQTIPQSGDYCTVDFYDANNNKIYTGGTYATITPYVPSAIISNLTFTQSSTANQYYVSADIGYSGSWDEILIKVERAVGDRYYTITCTPSQVSSGHLDTTPTTMYFLPSDTMGQFAEVYFYLNGVEVESDTQVQYIAQ